MLEEIERRISNLEKTINDSEFICVAPAKEVFNINGESLGIEGERALYYSTDIGTNRIYRSSYPIEPYYFKGKDINAKLKLLKHESINEAQLICNEINRIYGDNFEPKIELKKTKNIKNYF